MKIFSIPIIALLLASCATTPSMSEVERLSAQARLRDSAPMCDDSSCQKKWDAAQVWVTQNSAYKIQTVSTAIIETYNPREGDRQLGFRILKEPAGEGKYKLTINAFCANWLLGCDPNPLEYAQRFNDYINSVK